MGTRRATLAGVGIFALAIPAEVVAQASGGAPIPNAAAGSADPTVTGAAPPDPQTTGNPGAMVANPHSAAPASATTEDIIVTAQRRRENLQDVPVAITAVPAAELSRAGVGGVVDLKVSIPSLNITNSNGYLSSSIRGVGGLIVGPGIENQTSVYIDDVYYAFVAPSLLSLNNIAQVAALKGPQGTLFGRNATAGVLQITTRDPTVKPSGQIQFNYGNYDRISGSGYLAGQLVGGVRADIAAVYTKQSRGWGTNRTTGRDTYNVPYEYALRSKFILSPTATTDITLIGDYNKTRNRLASVTTFPGTFNGFTTPATGPAPDLGYDTVGDGPDVQFGDSYGFSGKLEQKVDAVELVSISAFRQSQLNFQFDFDALPLPYTNIFVKQKDRQFTQELRLQSAGNRKFKWVVGGFLLKGRAAYDPNMLVRQIPGSNITIRSAAETMSLAGFAQGTYEVLPDTNITGGVRYTDEKKTIENASQIVTRFTTGAIISSLVPPDREVKASRTTWRVSLDHRFSPEVLAYASFNTGFKSGGFNIGSPAAAPFNPETLSAYEAGLKTDLFDRRLRINAAAYYYDYKDIQVQLVNAGLLGTLNGPSAKIYGVDIDVEAVLSDRLRFSGGLNAASPEFGSWILNGVPTCPRIPRLGGSAAVVGDCAGNLIPLASRVSASGRLDYTADVAGGSLDLSGNLAYKSRFFFAPDNNVSQGPVAFVNITAVWTDPSGRFSGGGYVKNLTDKRTLAFSSANTGQGVYSARYAAPRTYGLTLGAKF